MKKFPNKIHFIGIGGVGMSGLALIMSEHGHTVSGSDMSDSANIEMLKNAGIKIFLKHAEENIPSGQDILIVRSSAIADDNIEYATGIKRELRCIKRGEMLAEVAQMYKCVIAVTGTHGKTSVTALLVHIMKEAGLNPGYMIGGKVSTWSKSANHGKLDYFITESDESDGTQIFLKPSILLVNNIEDDHSWTLGGEAVLYNNFKTIANAAELLIYGANPTSEKLFSSHPYKKVIDYQNTEEFTHIMPTWGDFQIYNAMIAYTTALHLGIPAETIKKALQTFPGVERRMSIRYNANDIILIEDYAHHPTEINAAISAIKKNYADYKLKVIFQPHRYARLKKYFDKFADELSFADEIYITDVFAAWSEKSDITSYDLVKKIGSKASHLSNTFQESAKIALKQVEKKEVIAIFGAGDIQEIIPYCLKILELENQLP